MLSEIHNHTFLVNQNVNYTVHTVHIGHNGTAVLRVDRTILLKKQ